MASDDAIKKQSGPDVSRNGSAAGAQAQGVDTTTAADRLYKQVKTLIGSSRSLDIDKAKLIVESADDAIKEFGSTQQEKKVQLKEWKRQASAILPPATLKDLKERAEGQLIEVGYPRKRWQRNTLLWVIGSGVLILTLAGIYKAFFELGPKPGSGPGGTQPQDSISLTLPDDMTIRNAIKFLADVDGFTADFNANCKDELLNARVNGGQLTGKSTVEIIELLRLRLKSPHPPADYSVNKLPEKGTYVISCK